MAGVEGVAEVLAGGGNFVVLRCESRVSAADLARRLLAEHGICVKDVTGRWADGEPRLRIAVRSAEDNARFTAALSDTLCTQQGKPRLKLVTGEFTHDRNVESDLGTQKGPSFRLASRTRLQPTASDTGGARLDQEDYQRLISGVRSTLGITASSRVLDVGCGCGTVLRDIGPGSALGVDYSSSQVRLARTLFPQAEFQHSEANAFETGEGEFDAVFSFGAAPYLPGRAYVKEMLARMTRGLRGGRCGLLADIPDAATREACEAYRAETVTRLSRKVCRHAALLLRPRRVDRRSANARRRAWVIEHFMRHYGYRKSFVSTCTSPPAPAEE